METRSIKRRRLITISSWPDVPARFETLNDDTLTTILEFVGDKSYAIYARINKHCKEIYLNTKGMTKETFLYGYGPLAVIINKIERALKDRDWELFERVGKGVVLYNRRDVLDWALEERNKELLIGICDAAATEGRLDLLKEVWNKIDDEDRYRKRNIFLGVSFSAACHGRLNVLKWIETKGFFIHQYPCATLATKKGHLNILQWLQEEKDLELQIHLYIDAIYGGGHLHIMKWLQEKKVPWSESTFRCAAEVGNLDILQWLHDEGCPWPEDDRYPVREEDLKPEVVDWFRVNGYGNKLI